MSIEDQVILEGRDGWDIGQVESMFVNKMQGDGRPEYHNGCMEYQETIFHFMAQCPQYRVQRRVMIDRIRRVYRKALEDAQAEAEAKDKHLEPWQIKKYDWIDNVNDDYYLERMLEPRLKDIYCYRIQKEVISFWCKVGVYFETHQWNWDEYENEQEGT